MTTKVRKNILVFRAKKREFADGNCQEGNSDGFLGRTSRIAYGFLTAQRARKCWPPRKVDRLTAPTTPEGRYGPWRGSEKRAVLWLPAQTSDTPRGRRTTTVPAILSCQPCFSLSQMIQRKPRNRTISEKAPAKARTNATRNVRGWPSCRTTLRPSTIP